MSMELKALLPFRPTRYVYLILQAFLSWTPPFFLNSLAYNSPPSYLMGSVRLGRISIGSAGTMNVLRRNFACSILLFANLAPIISTLASVVSVGDFNKDFNITWAPDHVNTSSDGHERSLMLDQRSGSAFASNSMFLFGQIDMQIKLIPGHSAGTVVAYYLTSDRPNRDELDFEFLGNVSGQPYILQTNVFADGSGDREERIYLWFDPTTDFHTYSILWNLHHIVFMVDWVPIRVYENHEGKGVPYPRRYPMVLRVSLWNGDNWATRGGRDKVDWSKGPFIASFRNHRIDACIWRGDARWCRGSSPTNWWNQPTHSSLKPWQRRLLKWARTYHMIYDYCNDTQRFEDDMPKECFLAKH